MLRRRRADSDSFRDTIERMLISLPLLPPTFRRACVMPRFLAPMARRYDACARVDREFDARLCDRGRMSAD